MEGGYILFAGDRFSELTAWECCRGRFDSYTEASYKIEGVADRNEFKIDGEIFNWYEIVDLLENKVVEKSDY